MAWDKNFQLATKVDITDTLSLTGAWVDMLDLPASSYTPRSGTMLTENFAKMGLAEFRLLISGVTLTGSPTSVDFEVHIEEAEDTAGLNVRPVCHFRLGAGAFDASPTGYMYRKTAASTVKEQFIAVGNVTKRFLRYNAKWTIAGGSSPTAQADDVYIFGRGIEVTLEDVPASS